MPDIKIDPYNQRWVTNGAGEVILINVSPEVLELRKAVANYVPSENLEEHFAALEHFRTWGRLLDAKKHYVDAMVDIYGHDAVKINNTRKMYGYRWVPTASMPPITSAPKLAFPGSDENALDSDETNQLPPWVIVIR